MRRNGWWIAYTRTTDDVQQKLWAQVQAFSAATNGYGTLPAEFVIHGGRVVQVTFPTVAELLTQARST